MGSSRLPENMTGQVLRIMLMAEEPNIGPAKAYDSHLELVARRERETGSKFTFPGATAALLFLGKRQKAAEFVRDADPNPGLVMDLGAICLAWHSQRQGTGGVGRLDTDAL